MAHHPGPRAAPTGAERRVPPKGSRTVAAAQRRAQILRAASRLFAERGFHGVGVDEIGAAVGVSGPALYRHFAGKDAMLTELLVGISGRLRDSGQQRVAEAEKLGQQPLTTLHELIASHIDFALDDRELITLHDRELDRLPDADRQQVRQLQRQYAEIWVRTACAAYPQLDDAQARITVHAVFGLLNSTPHLGRPAQPSGRGETGALLHRLARAAFAAAGGA